jgi:hypothetical protein
LSAPRKAGAAGLEGHGGGGNWGDLVGYALDSRFAMLEAHGEHFLKVTCWGR